MNFRIIPAICLFFLLTPNATAGEFTLTDEGLVYSGIVTPSDPEQFETEVREIANPTPIIVSVKLGNLNSALDIGLRIRKGGFPTRTGLTTCTALCGLIWLAGSDRVIAPEARLDFSPPDLSDGDPAEQIRLVNYLTRIGLNLETVIAVAGEWNGGDSMDHSTLETSGAREASATAPVSEEKEQPADGSEPTLFHPRYTHYTGDLVDGVPHGSGAMTSLDGDIYRGEFRFGRPDGDMVIEMAEGDLFTGHFVDGKPDGEGTIETAEGEVFDGRWENGGRVELHPRTASLETPEPVDRRQLSAGAGHGDKVVLELADGGRYSGGGVGGKPSGAGTVSYPDGSRFYGWFADGTRNGPGVMVLADGTATADTWKNGIARNAEDGDGGSGSDAEVVEQVEAKPITIGQAVAGLDRDGVMALQERLNALYYDVGVADGQAGPRTVAAIRAYANDFDLLEGGRVPADLIDRILGRNSVSQAGWQQTEMDGCKVWVPLIRAQNTLRWTGKCIGGYVDGPGSLAIDHVLNGKQVTYVFVGETNRGHLTGYGTEHWQEGHPASGEHYTGQFVEGRHEGRGKFFYADGSTYDGEWKRGMREGKGEYSSPAIGRVVGRFTQDKPNGYGEHYDPSGKLDVAGEFRNGCLKSDGKTVYVFTTRSACGF